MGLGFHIGQGRIGDLGEYLGQIEMDKHRWLQKNGFLLEGKTGHLPDPKESLPYFDDAVLTHAEVLTVKNRFDERKRQTRATPGFHSEVIAKIDQILTRLFDEAKGLSTCAD